MYESNQKLKLISIIIFSIILSIASLSLNAQVKSSSESDSTKIKKNNLIYNNKLKILLSNKMFLGQRDFYENSFNTTNLFSLEGFSNDTKEKTLLNLKLEMKNYRVKRKSFLPDYDLGEFGTYLGYANTLAVIFLAISHISKYGFK